MTDKIVTGLIVALLMAGGAAAQELPSDKSFYQKGGILELARADGEFDHRIIVQRATQAAIYNLPAVGIVDLIKATRSIGGHINNVFRLSEPLGSGDGLPTTDDKRDLTGQVRIDLQ